MNERNDSMREGLLSRLPRPENLVSYREETASLLAKHQRALYWEKWAAKALSFCGVAPFFLYIWITKARPLDTVAAHNLLGSAGVLLLFAAIYGVRLTTYTSQVATLKEVKQVQLQILELQASLCKVVEPGTQK
jgi:hypothetical protein